MKLPRLAVSAACAATVAGAMVAASSPASAATVDYVALGDSYSSGTGAGPYDMSGCLRSGSAYPAVWAAAHTPTSFAFAACSGATTTDVLDRQLGALTTRTSLASITIGGNDAGFADVMQTCVLQSNASCLSAVRTAETFMNDRLPGRLDTLFTSIRSKAPSARVVVLDYPHLYAVVQPCVGLSGAKRTALNAAADRLDTVIGAAAANAGFDFADVRGRFTGHELCSGDRWLNAVTIPVGDSYHPTALGHAQGYLSAFSAAASTATAARGRS